MKNYADRGGCHPPRPKAEVDNTLLDLLNSSYPTKAEFSNCFIIQACERAESSKSYNLIGSESGRYFTILPANLDGIVGSFIHKFVWCL